MVIRASASTEWLNEMSDDMCGLSRYIRGRCPVIYGMLDSEARIELGAEEAATLSL